MIFFRLQRLVRPKALFYPPHLFNLRPDVLLTRRSQRGVAGLVKIDFAAGFDFLVYDLSCNGWLKRIFDR